MADTLYTVDIIQDVGQTYVVSAALFGARIIYLTRDGIGMVQSDAVPTTEREYFYKTTGAFAYKIRFNSAATVKQHIHVIYKI